MAEQEKMTETEKMQQLHHRATTVDDLSPDEQKALDNWYAEMDREEEIILKNAIEVDDLPEKREQLNQTLSEISRTAANIERIAKQNEEIRRENEKLRKTLESRFPELLTA